MKRLLEIANFNLQPYLVIRGLLFVGLFASLTGCGNFVAGGDMVRQCPRVEGTAAVQIGGSSPSWGAGEFQGPLEGDQGPDLVL